MVTENKLINKNTLIFNYDNAAYYDLQFSQKVPGEAKENSRLPYEHNFYIFNLK